VYGDGHAADRVAAILNGAIDRQEGSDG
jgi:hypothetical protein